MSKLSRRKGHSFEREIASRLRVVFPEARRLLEYHAEDANGVDLLNTEFYRIQCKRGRKWCSLSKIEEVTYDELIGEVPVLVTQGDRKEILVALPFDEFLNLLQNDKRRDIKCTYSTEEFRNG